MKRKLISVLFIVVAVIHLLPLVGALGGDRLNGLYGLRIDDPNLQILMRHRAVLFGLLGGLFFVAAFRRSFQPLAFVAGFVSVASYLAIALAVGGYNDALQRVFTADLIALACLVLALLLFRQSR
jgi:hypothetical protein